MAGFARLCPGDVFEIVVKHGHQKWKSKGRIEKNGTQRWDHPDFKFKAVIGDVFNIKVHWFFFPSLQKLIGLSVVFSYVVMGCLSFHSNESFWVQVLKKLVKKWICNFRALSWGCWSRWLWGRRSVRPRSCFQPTPSWWPSASTPTAPSNSVSSSSGSMSHI